MSKQMTEQMTRFTRRKLGRQTRVLLGIIKDNLTKMAENPPPNAVANYDSLTKVEHLIFDVDAYLRFNQKKRKDKRNVESK